MDLTSTSWRSAPPVAALLPRVVPAVVDVEVAVLEVFLILILAGLGAVTPVLIRGGLLAAVSLHGA